MTIFNFLIQQSGVSKPSNLGKMRQKYSFLNKNPFIVRLISRSYPNNPISPFINDISKFSCNRLRQLNFWASMDVLVSVLGLSDF